MTSLAHLLPDGFGPLALRLAAPLALVLAPTAGARTEAGAPQDSEPAPSIATPDEERGDPFLWTVEGTGPKGEPIRAYLFGTVHLPDARVLALPTEVETAFEASDAFYAEIEATAASQRAVQRLAMLPANLSMPDLAGPELWERVVGRMRAKGLNEHLIQAYERFEPWAVSALLPQLDFMEDIQKGKTSLDETLYKRAASAGKATQGLEKVEEQIAVFTAFDRAEQLDLLREGLDQLERDEAQGKDPVEETIVAWLSGDEARLLDILEMSFQVDPHLKKRAEDGLLWRRNLRFADRIDRALVARPDQVAFIAIGALHMPDPRPEKDAKTDGEVDTPDGSTDEGADAERRAGLVTLLRERGYRVERVRAPETVGAGR